MLGTPSSKGVMTCSCPCQCMVVLSLAMAFMTVTSSQSPWRTTMGGPGTVPLAVTSTLSRPGTMLGTTTLRTSSTKRRTGPGPPVTPSMYGHGHVDSRVRLPETRSMLVHGRCAWPAAHASAATTATLVGAIGPPRPPPCAEAGGGGDKASSSSSSSCCAAAGAGAGAGQRRILDRTLIVRIVSRRSFSFLLAVVVSSGVTARCSSAS